MNGVDDARRARIVAAMAYLVARDGYARATISEIVARAGVSREAFYELFTDRHDCLLAAFDRAVAQGWERVREAYDPQLEWRVRIRTSLIALLEFFEDEPGTARLLLLESPSAGERVLERRSRVLARIRAVVQLGQAEATGRTRGVPLNADGLVSAAVSVIQIRMQDDKRPPLLELVNPLMAMIVLPYHGWEASAHELAQPVPRWRANAALEPAEAFGELGVRLTRRTVAVLRAIAEMPGASNRLVAERVGISDQGQISRLLRRLEGLELIRNQALGIRGVPNAWLLTVKGARLHRVAIRGLDPPV